MCLFMIKNLLISHEVLGMSATGEIVMFYFVKIKLRTYVYAIKYFPC